MSQPSQSFPGDDAHQPLESGHDTVSTTQEPPTTFWKTMRRLGPGLIIAGSIVGSGELIATTKTAAEAGMSLLWLIIVGCLIKVFCQIELGRYTICSGQTTLAALNTVPGPKAKVNWIVWWWLLMMVASVGQLGGIVGGVGQSLAIAYPLTGDYVQAITLPSEREWKRYLTWQEQLPREEQRLADLSGSEREELEFKLKRIRQGQEFLDRKLDGQAWLDTLAELKDSAGADTAKTQQDIESLERQLERHRERIAAARAAVLDLMAAETPIEQAKRELAQVQISASGDAAAVAQAQQHLEEVTKAQEASVKEAKAKVNALLEPKTYDDKIWAVIAAAVTIALLYRGRYRVVENLSTILVVTFTFVTVGNVLALEMQPKFRLELSDFLRGFGLPEEGGLATALATFGIIGVGATELIAYPYWCLEKGYARFTGPPSPDPAWERRAKGWLRVMHYDAFVSMIIYTVATVAFFLMGVAVLHKQGLVPDGMRMVSTLMEQYRPVFGEYAQWLFLIGAIAVLYSTFLVATAGHSRTYTDSLKIFEVIDPNSEVAHRRSISAFCIGIPIVCVITYASGLNPVTLVLVGALMQALMLPVLGFASVYFRFTRTDPRLKPGRVWDTLLVVSFLGLLVTGLWNLYELFFV